MSLDFSLYLKTPHPVSCYLPSLSGGGGGRGLEITFQIAGWKFHHWPPDATRDLPPLISHCCLESLLKHAAYCWYVVATPLLRQCHWVGKCGLLSAAQGCYCCFGLCHLLPLRIITTGLSLRLVLKWAICHHCFWECHQGAGCLLPLGTATYWDHHLLPLCKHHWDLCYLYPLRVTAEGTPLGGQLLVSLVKTASTVSYKWRF